ncbi:ABC transporter permease, partial [Isoptericola halotolerans]
MSATAAILERDVRAKLRTPWPYVESLADPVLLLVLFAPLVGAVGAMPGIPPGDTLQWFVPGMLVVMTFSTSAFIGSGLQEERASGALERILVTPAPRSAILTGRVGRVVVTSLVQAAVITAATVPFGLRLPSAPAATLAVLELGLLAAALGVCSLAVGIAVQNAYAFWGAVTLVYTPLIVTSGALLPMEVAPDWLYALSRLNPLAHAVDAQRALFAGELASAEILLGAA